LESHLKIRKKKKYINLNGGKRKKKAEKEFTKNRNANTFNNVSLKAN